jgi:putative ABC transport system substrate-binding protein
MSARRQVLRVIAASVLAAPFSSRGQLQAARIRRIGYLSPLTPAADSTRSEAFRRGLQDLGYVEGRNILIERRFSEGRLDRLAALAAELVRLKVEVIVAAGGAVIARAARSATTAIPIVMTNVEMRTAKALGITFPHTILVRAEQVIE